MLRERFTADMKEAMKAGDKGKLGAIRLIQAALKDKDIEARGNGKEPLSDEEILALLQKMVKQRKDSLEIFQQQNRADLAQKEAEEIAVIEKFLPRQLSETELKDALSKIIAETGASSPADMGKVMGVATKQLAGKADGKAISAAVKELLSK